MKTAVIALDDWKLPIFRKRLTDAGFSYEDKGAGPGETTLLAVKFEEGDLAHLTRTVVACQNEAARTGRPGK